MYKLFDMIYPVLERISDMIYPILRRIVQIIAGSICVILAAGFGVFLVVGGGVFSWIVLFFVSPYILGGIFYGLGLICDWGESWICKR